MSWVLASGVRGTLTRTAVAAAIAGVAVMGATVPANATPARAGLPGVPVPLRPLAVQDDPGCAMFGWRHPLCAGAQATTQTAAVEAIPFVIPYDAAAARLR